MRRDTAMRFCKHARFRQRQSHFMIEAVRQRNGRYADRQNALSARFAKMLNGKNLKGWTIGQIDSRIVVVLA